jgi:hypothetical protein
MLSVIDSCKSAIRNVEIVKRSMPPILQALDSTADSRKRHQLQLATDRRKNEEIPEIGRRGPTGAIR